MLENPTPSESALEPAIAALGLRYRCQHAFLGLKHFADFALLDDKILIEVDGDSHNAPAQKEKDLLHSIAVLKLGWVTVRFTNEQATQYPEETAEQALKEGLRLQALDKALLEFQYSGQLDQLRQDYPHLLVAAAKLATRRQQSALKGAQKRAPAVAARRRAKAQAAQARVAAAGSSVRKNNL